MIGQMFVINRVEQRLFVNIQKIRDLKNEDPRWCQELACTLCNAGQIVGMGEYVIGCDDLRVALFC